MRRRFALLSLPLTLFPRLGSAPTGTRGEDKGTEDELATLRKELEELKRSFSEFKTSTTRNSGLISNLSRTSPPVGTVMAFAGAWPPKDSKGKQWNEAELGWLLCNGTSLDKLEREKRLDLSELRAVLPTPNLPDYQGYFLRGIDREVGDMTQRRDQDGVRSLNSTQAWGTAMPHKTFAIAPAGKHTHQIPTAVNGDSINSGTWKLGWGGFSKHDYQNSPPTSEQPDHSHTMSGGDTETRPINVAVYWIIKFK